MPVIPSDIHREILLRLPADSLWRFRNVCRAWRRIIDDPSFVRSHSINQNSNCSFLLLRNYEGGCLYSLPLETLNHKKDGNQTIKVAPIKQLMSRMYSLPAAVCNGLFLIYDIDFVSNRAIWNPLTQDFHKLPVADIHSLTSVSSYKLDRIVSWSLGYDRGADDYKVVRIDRLCDDDADVVLKTLIYSLKLGVWRVSKDFPGKIWTEKGVYLNGSLYWRSRKNEIIVLDLGTEDYSRLHGPPLPAGYSYEHLEAMGGCLVFSCYDAGMRRLEGWIMEENSWVKLFSVRTFRDCLKPVAYLRKKGVVILQQFEEALFWLDVESNSVRKMSIEYMCKVSSVQCFPGSLFRLNATAAGVKRKRARKRQHC